MANFDKEEIIVQPSLQSQLIELTDLCQAAYATEDVDLFSKAFKLASAIEKRLWQYFMEVKNR